MLPESDNDFRQIRSAMQAVYDAKSEEIGPGIYRFKAEIGQSCDTALVHLSLQSDAICLIQTSLQPWLMGYGMFIAFCFCLQPGFDSCIRSLQAVVSV